MQSFRGPTVPGLRAGAPVSAPKRKLVPTRVPQPSFARPLYDEITELFEQSGANKFVRDRQLRLSVESAPSGPGRKTSDALADVCVRLWFQPSLLKALTVLDLGERASALAEGNGESAYRAETDGGAELGYNFPAEIVIGAVDSARTPPDGAVGFIDLSYRALMSAMTFRARSDATSMSPTASRGPLNSAYTEELHTSAPALDPPNPPNPSDPLGEVALDPSTLKQPPALLPASFMHRMAERPVTAEQAEHLAGSANFMQSVKLLQEGYDPTKRVFAADYELILTTAAEFGRLWLHAAADAMANNAHPMLPLEEALERAGCLGGPYRQPVAGAMGGLPLLSGKGPNRRTLLLVPGGKEDPCASTADGNAVLFQHHESSTRDYDERWHSSAVVAVVAAPDKPLPWANRAWALLRALAEVIKAPMSALKGSAPPLEASEPEARDALRRLCADPWELIQCLTLLPTTFNLKNAANHFERLQQSSQVLFDVVGDITAFTPLWATGLIARRLARAPPLCLLDVSAETVPFVGAFATAIRVYTPFNNDAAASQLSFIEMRGASGPSQSLDNKLRCFAAKSTRLLEVVALQRVVGAAEAQDAAARGGGRVDEATRFDAYAEGYWEQGFSDEPAPRRRHLESETDPGHEEDEDPESDADGFGI